MFDRKTGARRHRARHARHSRPHQRLRTLGVVLQAAARAASALSHVECSKCARRYDADAVAQLCECGAPLLARYDLKAAAKTFTRENLAQREQSLWRYTELLPVRDQSARISLSESFTPLVLLAKIGADIGVNALTVKDEGFLPTGSFKARGAAIGVSRARELGVTRFAMPTNGNAGGAWAAYGARGGLQAYIVMPQDAPAINKFECINAGANVWLVDGLIGDAGRIVGKAVKRYGLYDASTLKEPYRIEGKKTLGFEIVEQFDWTVPDVILYPTGGGVGIIGIYKAFLELQELGLIANRMPRFVVVQAEGCAPIVRAWQEHKRESIAWQNAQTVAFGINVPKAIGDFLVLDAVYATNGTAIAVSDAELLEMQQQTGEHEGLLLSPEGTATLAAAKRLREQHWIAAGERVLAINTGSGLKSAQITLPDLPLLAQDDELAL